MKPFSGNTTLCNVFVVNKQHLSCKRWFINCLTFKLALACSFEVKTMIWHWVHFSLMKVFNCSILYNVFFFWSTWFWIICYKTQNLYLDLEFLLSLKALGKTFTEFRKNFFSVNLLSKLRGIQRYICPVEKRNPYFIKIY